MLEPRGMHSNGMYFLSKATKALAGHRDAGNSLIFILEGQFPDVSLTKLGARAQQPLALQISQDLCRR